MCTANRSRPAQAAKWHCRLIDGATHPYVGAVSACGPPFAEVNVSLPPAPMSRLVPDACLVQHPGAPEHRATQSLGLQLLGL